MLATIPTPAHVAHGSSRPADAASPIRRTPFVQSTPSPMPPCRPPLRASSPLKRHSMPEAPADDDVFSSPAHSSFTLINANEGIRRPKSLFDGDDDGLFLAPPSSVQSHSIFPPSSSPMPLRTPIKPVPGAFQTPGRPVLSIKPINTPFSAAAGTKRKPAPLPFNTPERKCMLTPLNVTSAAKSDAGSGGSIFGFDRLAPLSAPRFGTRTPQTRADTEQHLKNQADSMGKLKLGDRTLTGEESGYDSGVEHSRKDTRSGPRLYAGKSTPGTVKSKAKKSSGPLLLKAKDEVVEAISPGGHVSKRRARSRPVSSELLNAVANTPATETKSQVCKTPTLSSIKTSNSVAFPSYPTARSRRTSASSTSSVDVGSPVPRTRLTSNSTSRTRTQSQHQRASLNRLTSHSSASLFFGPSIPQTEARQKKPSSGAMSIDVPPPPFVLSGRPQTRTRHSTGSPWRSPKRESDEMNEEDLFFSSPSNPSFAFKIMGSTPSPTKKQRVESVEKLPKKYRPRDSGVMLDDSDDDVFDPPPRLGLRIGLSMTGQASGSFSSIQSESDLEALVTPGTGPSPQSGWPSVDVVNLDHDEGFRNGADATAGVDAFILRTLAAGAKPSVVPGEPKRVPGTPVKKVKTSHLLERPWQSAVAAHKIGFPEFDREPKDAIVGKENKKAKPRQSMPMAFPTVRQRKNARLGADLDNDDEEASPTTRKETKYDNLGLGLPPVPPFPKSSDPKARTRWLMRRSSSGAFSSGSEATTSRNATPTRLLAKDWISAGINGVAQQSPLATFAPLLDTASSNASAASSTVVSPTEAVAARHGRTTRKQGRNASQTAAASNASPKKASAQRASHARASVFPGSAIRGRPSISSSEERPGRFEHDFVEIDEVGFGEFGRVIKARYKSGSQEDEFAVKKSKRFEGLKHRLRLREEVDILKHLSQAAMRGGFGLRHPNVLGYVDSWEEDETLFIQTELCGLGNFEHFLWEYGRTFPRLDEARVWKIFVELSAGMEFIHNADVIHLDLKPANIFVTGEGRFKIGDFGMASIWPRPVPKDTATTGERVSFEREGDKLYLAPEVLQGRYSKAADIFSLGMTMLETATNIIVPDQGEAWHRIRHEDFAQVDLAGLSSEFVELLKSTLRSDPALRIDARLVNAHPVITRVSHSMDSKRREVGSVFEASALAGAPAGWLDFVLGHSKGWNGHEDDEDEPMDVCL